MSDKETENIADELKKKFKDMDSSIERTANEVKELLKNNLTSNLYTTKKVFDYETYSKDKQKLLDGFDALQERYKHKYENLKNKLQNQDDKILVQEFIDKRYNTAPSVADKYNNDNISKIYDKINKISQYVSRYKNFEYYSNLTFEEFENAVNTGSILALGTDLRTKWNSFSQEEKNEYYNKFIKQSKEAFESIKTINSPTKSKDINGDNINKLKELVNEITKLKPKECKIYQEFCNEMIKELNENKKESLSSGGHFFEFLIKSKTTQESIQLEYYEKINNKITESIKSKSLWNKLFNK